MAKIHVELDFSKDLDTLLEDVNRQARRQLDELLQQKKIRDYLENLHQKVNLKTGSQFNSTDELVLALKHASLWQKKQNLLKAPGPSEDKEVSPTVRPKTKTEETTVFKDNILTSEISVPETHPTHVKEDQKKSIKTGPVTESRPTPVDSRQKKEKVEKKEGKKPDSKKHQLNVPKSSIPEIQTEKKPKDIDVENLKIADVPSEDILEGKKIEEPWATDQLRVEELKSAIEEEEQTLLRNSTPYSNWRGRDSTRTETSTLNLGIDFGTSNSKIMVNDDAMGFFVVENNKSFLFPCTIYQKGDEYNLSKSQSSVAHKDVKLRLIDRIHSLPKFSDQEEFLIKLESAEEFKIASIYISKLIQHTINWCEKENEAYSGQNIFFQWDVIIGFPSIPAHDEHQKQAYDRLKSSFEHLIAVSFYLSQANDSKITDDIYSQVCKAHSLDTSIDARTDNPSWNTAYPEILAQLCTIVQTDFSIGGKYILVDIGAGTLDTITFFNNKEENTFSVYQAAVASIGAHKLHLFRKDRLTEILLKEGKDYRFQGVEPEDNSDGSVFKNNNYTSINLLSEKRAKELLEKIDCEFFEWVYRIVMGNFQDTYENLKNAFGRRPPKENFHIMITGGGSLIPIYKNAIQKLPFSTINDYTIDELDFPTPQDIVGIPSEKLNKIFHRLSIAYGLSHGSMNLFAVSTNALGDANHVPKSPVCIQSTCTEPALKNEVYCIKHLRKPGLCIDCLRAGKQSSAIQGTDYCNVHS